MTDQVLPPSITSMLSTRASLARLHAGPLPQSNKRTLLQAARAWATRTVLQHLNELGAIDVYDARLTAAVQQPFLQVPGAGATAIL